MELSPAIIFLVVGVTLGGAIAVFVARRQGPDLTESVAQQMRALVDEQGRLAEEHRDAAVAAAMQQFAVHNEAVLAGERARGSEELDGKKTLIDQQLSVMTGELGKVSELVREFEHQRQQQYGQLSQQLTANHEGLNSLLQTTQSLREALSSTKARGQWGERMAEDVLRLAGFIENVNYRKQRSPDGITGIPDFTFFLPNDLMLHMDVKFPLDNYLRWLESESELDQKRYRDGFLRDVKARVKELASRDYIDPAGGTVDFVLLFIPNEQLYGFIHEQDGSILEEAARQRVVFCSPLTLFAVLALIRQTVENFQLARTSDQILGLLGQFSEQWGKYLEQTGKLGQRLESVNRAFEELAGPRRRMLEKPLKQIDALRQQQELNLEEGDPLTTLALEA
jgi:DNA recombination protein RmuC